MTKLKILEITAEKADFACHQIDLLNKEIEALKAQLQKEKEKETKK